MKFFVVGMVIGAFALLFSLAGLVEALGVIIAIVLLIGLPSIYIVHMFLLPDEENVFKKQGK